MLKRQAEILDPLAPQNLNVRLIWTAKNLKESWSLQIPVFPLVIGREASCQFRLSSAKVSKRHCQLCFNGNQLVIQDLDSTNGTFVNKVRIQGQRPLKHGDVLSVGGWSFAVALSNSDLMAELETEDNNHEAASENQQPEPGGEMFMPNFAQLLPRRKYTD